MSFPDAAWLSESYGSNHWLITRIIEGLSHEDSLAQPPFKANCLNWVLGHIISGRNEALSYLGVDQIWTEEELSLYQTGSDPITEDAESLPFQRLINDLELSQEKIVEALEDSTPEQLAKVEETRFGPRPVAEHLAGLQWHETYHMGQLEILRELAQ